MVVKEEREKVKTLLSETITLLCKNGLNYKAEFCIEALIGITLDKDDVFLVNIKETIRTAAPPEPDSQCDRDVTVTLEDGAMENRDSKRDVVLLKQHFQDHLKYGQIQPPVFKRRRGRPPKHRRLLENLHRRQTTNKLSPQQSGSSFPVDMVDSSQGAHIKQHTFETAGTKQYSKDGQMEDVMGTGPTITHIYNLGQSGKGLEKITAIAPERDSVALNIKSEPADIESTGIDTTGDFPEDFNSSSLMDTPSAVGLSDNVDSHAQPTQQASNLSQDDGNAVWQHYSNDDASSIPGTSYGAMAGMQDSDTLHAESLGGRWVPGSFIRKRMCRICGKEFSCASHLSRHVKWIHSTNRLSVQCSVCAKTFSRPDKLTGHMRNRHPDVVQLAPEPTMSYRHASHAQTLDATTYGADAAATSYPSDSVAAAYSADSAASYPADS